MTEDCGCDDSAASDGAGGEPIDADRVDAYADGVSRRRLIRSSLAAGTAGAAASTAGCTGLTGGNGGDGGPKTVFVFNTADKTVSIIDAATDELLASPYLGATASFPSNQWTPSLLDSETGSLWLDVKGGVKAVDPTDLSDLTTYDTGTGKNWQELTPDGSSLVVSAREPAHTQYRIDADTTSDTFGEVTAELDRSDEVDNEKGGPGPCDITVGPDGKYAYVPDIFSDTLTVLDVPSFEIVAQPSVDPVGEADSVRPWMGTVSWDGSLLTVENNEGDHGTESIWDVSDPENPTELVRLTADDDLGGLPLTSEITPDNSTAYVFTPSSKDVTVVDLQNREVTGRIDLGGKAFVGTWGPSREKLYVPVMSSNEVKVIEAGASEVSTTVGVGAKPYGATAGRVRPQVDGMEQVRGALASLGLQVGNAETTYCVGECACGFEPRST
ncbi:MAG: hypothetical protein ABEJ08_00705 [Halobacteriaceae archaeon]